MAAAPKKEQVYAWLKEQGWTFTEMSDDQKLEMRQEWKICGGATSTSKYTKPCTFTPMTNGRCHVHGGKTPKGIASTTYIDGSDSEYIPKPLIANYERAMNDPDLLALNKEIALLKARRDQLLTRVDSGETGKNWQAIKSQLIVTEDAITSGDTDAFKESIILMKSLVARGERDYEAWGEIGDVFETIRKLSETEAKRRERMRAIVPIEQVMWTFRQLANANRQVILEHPEVDQQTARDLLMKIAERFAHYTGRSSDQPEQEAA
jgi:hypothetical protein